ncbi:MULTISPECIES: YqgQ family protein [Ornithinibacillus]|uniref:YqgQ family protein n=2 Tax=Ornithinibacillus TaxID=484508 RepID=A0A923L6D8_9BACI|nr:MULTISPECIES: YqgQ family protein [Ornithinibacillus]MBC5637210.1 YqgQ family protein [Ornithinibacillus hominis]MBS3679579.1 YqgQ family protein [Ornithinibacillus massiliensis]
MNTLYDVLQLLKRFGTFIYTGNRLADLELMQTEIKELYSYGLIDVEDYRLSLLIIRQEINKLHSEKGEK